jgi:hypothetical protein
VDLYEAPETSGGDDAVWPSTGIERVPLSSRGCQTGPPAPLPLPASGAVVHPQSKLPLPVAFPDSALALPASAAVVVPATLA